MNYSKLFTISSNFFFLPNFILFITSLSPSPCQQ